MEHSPSTFSKVLIATEALVVILPVAIIMSFGNVFILQGLLSTPSAFDIALVIISILATIALASLITIGYELALGKYQPSENPVSLWWLVLMGIALIAASWASHFLPPSPPYSDEASFREMFELFRFGSPLILVAAHLAYEAKKC